MHVFLRGHGREIGRECREGEREENGLRSEQMGYSTGTCKV